MKYDELHAIELIFIVANSNMRINISFSSRELCMQFINDIIV